MTAFASNFFSVSSRRAFTAQNVFPSRNGFKMFRIYTPTVSTKVVQLKTRWNFLSRYFERDSMSVCHFPSNSHVPVTVNGSGDPYPTLFSFLNFIPKPLFNSFHAAGHSTDRGLCK